MSLRNALISATNIEVKDGILTVSDINNSYNLSTSYSCFIDDIDSINHPQYGKGKILDFKNNKWVVDFECCSSLQEFKTKHIVHYLNCFYGT